MTDDRALQLQTITFAETQVDTSDLVLFLEAKRVTPTCPACGTQGWQLSLSPNGGHYPGITAMGGDPTVAPMFLGLFLTICNHCGFVRQFALSQVVTWKKAL